MWLKLLRNTVTLALFILIRLTWTVPGPGNTAVAFLHVDSFYLADPDTADSLELQASITFALASLREPFREFPRKLRAVSPLRAETVVSVSEIWI